MVMLCDKRMKQILVTDKVFITPEFKRKKKMYKWNFILSVVIIGILSIYCVYASYDMNKSEEENRELFARTFPEINEVLQFIKFMVRRK